MSKQTVRTIAASASLGPRTNAVEAVLEGWIHEGWRIVSVCPVLHNNYGSGQVSVSYYVAVLEHSASAPEAPQPSQVQIAERIAREAHAGQKDTVTGADYITHVERVVALVEGDDAKAVAWLHDVIEDNPAWSFERLEQEGILPRLIRPVSLLTRRPPYSYADYIDDIATAGEPLAQTVKIADLVDHLRPNCPARLGLRYEAALTKLRASAPPADPPQE
jgi:hypothetical protein